MSFNKSELILNDDGSIYHLGLRPNDIVPTIVTVGDQERVGLIADRLDKILFQKQCREFRTVTGELGSNLITIISTGIGTDNIDIVLNELDALVNVDLESRMPKEELRSLNFIRLGTSGAIQPTIPLDSLLVSDFAVGMDGLMKFYSPETRVSVLEDQIDHGSTCAFFAHADLLSLFGNSFMHGITITAAGFYGPQSRTIRLDPMVDIIDLVKEVNYEGLQITNLEMETAGIYGLSSLLGHKAISVSSILANRVSGEFSTNPSRTVSRMLDKALEIINDSDQLGLPFL